MKVAIGSFAGCIRLRGAWIGAGLRVACPIEKELGSWADVETPGIADAIVSWIELGLIWFVHLATPCT